MMTEHRCNFPEMFWIGTFWQCRKCRQDYEAVSIESFPFHEWKPVTAFYGWFKCHLFGISMVAAISLGVLIGLLTA